MLVVTSTVLTLGAFDAVLRLMGYRPTVYADWLLRTGNQHRVPNHDVIMIDPDFLDPDHYVVEPGRKTIVALGDSFTYGYPVDDDYSYPAFLQRWLGHQGANVNIVNMGMGHSGPDQHLRLFKDYVRPKVDVDAVVWAFYTNDLNDNIVQAAYRFEDSALVPMNGNLHWLAIRQRLHTALPLPLSLKESSPVLRLLYLAIEIAGSKLTRLASGTHDIADSEKKIQLAIRELERLSELDDFELYIVLIAPQVKYLEALGESSPLIGDPELQRLARPHSEAHSRLRALLGDRERYIDVWFGTDSPAGCGHAAQQYAFNIPTDLTIFTDSERDGNHLGDRHFNEAGYTLMAETVGRCLVDSGSGLAPGGDYGTRRLESSGEHH